MRRSHHLILEQTRQILQTLATSHPDFRAFQQAFAVPATADLPAELLDDTLAVLSEDPQQAAAIEALSDHPGQKSFITTGEVAMLVVVAFLLRTHIKLERTTTGNQSSVINRS